MLSLSRASTMVAKLALASALVVGALIVQSAGVLAGVITCTTSWQTGANGDWNVAGNWNAGVPDSSDDACLPAGNYTVTVDNITTAVAQSLDVATGVTLNIKGTTATTLTVSGNVTNTGTVRFGFGTTSHPIARLAVTTGTFSNSGAITTAASAGNALDANVSNGPSGTITLSAAMSNNKVASFWTNDGSIVLNGQLDISTNASFVMAAGSITGTSLLHVFGGVFDHTGGTITAATNLENVRLKPRSSGGFATLHIVNNGSVLDTDVAAADTVVVDGGFAGFDGVLTGIENRVNNGTIRLVSASNAVNAAKLVFAAGLTLTNNGTIETTVGLNGPARAIKASLINNGTIDIKYDLDFDQASTTYIQNSGTTTVAPGATLDLTGSNGTLALSGGTLSGGGTVKGQVNNHAGTVGPGSSPGILTVDGNFTQDNSGTLAMEIGGTNPGVQSDRLTVTGFVALNGTLALQKTTGFFPTTAFSYDFMSYSALGGSFAAVTGVNAGGGKSFVTNLNATVGTLSVTAGPITRQPDGLIAIGSGSFIGNSVYNLDGTNQSQSKSVKAGKTVTFFIKVQNDGTGAKDRFQFDANGAAATGLIVKFFRGSTDVTTSVNNGTFLTGKLGAGAQATIKCTVKVTSNAGHGDQVVRLITITSNNDGSARDAVKLTAGRT